MTQYARPDADGVAGSWTPYPASPTTLYDKIDETSHNDATDYITTTAAATTCQIGLSDVTDPVSETGHILHFWATATGSSGAEKVTMFLFEGVTQRATSGAKSITRTTWNEYTYTLSAAEANAITDYTNLSVKFTSAQTAGETLNITQGYLEVPDAPLDPRQAEVSWAEFEVPTAPRAAEVSWAELEIPLAPRSAEVSWAELEVPLVPRAAEVSWAELEVPTAPRQAEVSWAELEVPLAPRQAEVSWTEIEVPDAPRAAEVSWAELEIPLAPRAAEVSWAEFQVPDAGRAAEVSWAEMEVPLAPRSAEISWAELEVPFTARAAEISWCELEVPLAARACEISWAEMKVPAIGEGEPPNQIYKFVFN